MVDFSEDMKSQWHPSLNLPLTPETLKAVSKPVWWLGECGHSWQSTYLDKSRGYGCSYCSGKKILIGFNDLESQFPELAKEWHATKNGDLLPSQISSKSSNKKVWWQCKLGHEWDAKPLHRTNGSGCPFCAGSKIFPGFNDMVTTNPQLAAEWHPTKNLPIAPSEISASNPKKYWWICPDEGHEWQAQASDRNRRNTSCYYCSDFKVLVGYNDLTTTRPDLAQEWHPTKNGENTPQKVSANKSVKAWWLCSLDHEWEASVSSRSKGSGCPTCSGNRVLIGFNDLASRSPHLLAEWHPVKNLPKLPTDYSWSSGFKVWWKGKCDHEWEAKISNRNNGAGCPVCNAKLILRGFNDLESQNPGLAKEWHAHKNQLKPHEVTPSSNKKVWWLGKCGHEWQTVIANRTAGNGCPYCSGNEVLTGFNDLATVSPKLALEWNYLRNAPLTPKSITFGSKVKVWWNCPKGHEWLCSPNQRQSSSCHYCGGSKVLIGFNDLATTRPELVKEWHPAKNGSLKITDISAGSGLKPWWLCKNGHEWSAVVSDRSRGFGCPSCANHVSKAEKEIHDFLVNLGLNVDPSNRKVLDGKEIDLYLPELNFGIEFNGIYWHAESRKGKTYHYDKWKTAQDKGITLLQIWEDDWRDRKNVLMKALAHKLKAINEFVIAHPEYASELERIGARKTTVTNVSVNDARKFLDENHVQGYASGSYYLGLMDTQGKLRALLVLKKEKDSTGDNVLNIIRYATHGLIQGGFTKLVKHAAVIYQPGSFVTFADHCISDGSLYENHGFTVDKEIAPDYMYVVGLERKHKFGYRLKRFRDDPDLIWQDHTSERELAVLNGLERIWDAGKTKYRLTL